MMTNINDDQKHCNEIYSRNENLAGPNYEGGISVISPGSHSDRRYSRHGGVVQSPGGGGHDSHHDNHHHGSLDSIHSRGSSSSPSFDSSLSYGRYPELRSSLRKPGQKDSASLTSTSSSKKSVRLALGGEMTAV